MSAAAQKIVAALEALSREELLELAADGLLGRLTSPPKSLFEQAFPGFPVAKKKPTAKLRRELATKPRAGGRKKGLGSGASGGNVDAVFKCLAAAGEPLAPREICERTKLESDEVRYALIVLRTQGRAEGTGRAQASRWSIAA